MNNWTRGIIAAIACILSFTGLALTLANKDQPRQGVETASRDQ